MIRICAYCGLVYDKSDKGYNKYCSDKCIDGIRRDRNRDRWREANPGWNETINKICTVCGKTFEASKRCSNRAIFCSDKCKQILRNYGGLNEYKSFVNDKRLQKTKLVKQRKLQREIELASRLIEKKCLQCGEMFKTLQPNQLTCSTKCSKNRRSRRNDKRLNKDNIVDRDISLATLYKRDKGICYICGTLCNFDDYSKDKSNNVTVGKTYPTIDHIIPLARGGMHAWDNIRLAHHLCNSVKSDNIPRKAKELIPNNAYVLARKVSSKRKQVKQFSKDNKLIAIYESTIEAGTITGVKIKGIQNCARGERKTYGGYLWSY